MAIRYLSAERMKADDFNVPFTNQPGEIVYDGATIQGPWATMTEESFRKWGRGQIGTGKAQKYIRQDNGELHKAEG